MKTHAYRVFVDIWRLSYKYGFQKLNDSQWEDFVNRGNWLYRKYKGTPVGPLFRYLFMAVQNYYEIIGKS